ncbi:hypothetical protein [uncultured Bacteroides sp.]|uniref:hypothetical protein n=1 Tax=uncultured Bacteroides sp. TaxID=162156 RepID=UPI002AAB7C03|nr:hypothetical protein [uncultured Bacteroides sp.]
MNLYNQFTDLMGECNSAFICEPMGSRLSANGFTDEGSWVHSRGLTVTYLCDKLVMLVN